MRNFMARLANAIVLHPSLDGKTPFRMWARAGGYEIFTLEIRQKSGIQIDRRNIDFTHDQIVVIVDGEEVDPAALDGIAFLPRS